MTGKTVKIKKVKRERVPSTSEVPESLRCLICGAQATGFHFGSQSCSACAAFFRRTVSLTKSFECITSMNQCLVHYSMPQTCRGCRFNKCLASGMKRNGVQPKKPKKETGRTFFTKSGLKRNKKFASVSPLNADEQRLIVETSILSPKVPKMETDQESNPSSNSSCNTSTTTSSCSPCGIERMDLDDFIKSPNPRKDSNSSTLTNVSTPNLSPVNTTQLSPVNVTYLPPLNRTPTPSPVNNTPILSPVMSTPTSSPIMRTPTPSPVNITPMPYPTNIIPIQPPVNITPIPFPLMRTLISTPVTFTQIEYPVNITSTPFPVIRTLTPSPVNFNFNPCPSPVNIPPTPSPVSMDFVFAVPAPPEPPVPSVAPKPRPNTLNVFIKQEMKLGEQRRLLFSGRCVGTLLGKNRQCPYKKEDIKPLVFHDFRIGIKTHIMLVHEWLEIWPEFEELDDFDRMSLLRKAVLIHFLLDPSFLTYQIGEPDKLIMQNGGYISTADHHGVGWEDEDDIIGNVKRKYYLPVMKQITDEIMPAMQAMNITFEEFVALKALASFQGAFDNVSKEKRHLITEQVNRLLSSLHDHYLEIGEENAAERFGAIVLMLSNIFTSGNDFVKNHREIDIFHIWDLDELGLQLLNLDKILETEVRKEAEKRAERNGINVVNVGNNFPHN